MDNKRLVWADLLRVVSVFFVIIIHVSSVGLREYGTGSADWVFSGVLNCVSRWAVPVFFMISGMFFLDPEKRFDFGSFLKKNVLRILICIVFWGLFYSFLDQYLYGTLSWRSIPIALFGILTSGTGYHLWFLYTLLILYLSTPVLRIFTEHASRRQIDLALVIWFLLAVAIPTINAFSKRLFDLSPVFPYEPIAVAGYGGYYLLGFRLKKYPLKNKMFWLSQAAGAIMLVSMTAADMILSLKEKDFFQAASAPFGIGTCLISISVFSLFSHLDLKEKWITWAGKRVFGVYIVHVFWISLLFHIIKVDISSFAALPSIIFYSVAVFALSLLTSWLLGSIPLIRKTV